MCSHEGSGTKCAHRNTSLSDSAEGINEEEADHEEEVVATNGTAAPGTRGSLDPYSTHATPHQPTAIWSDLGPPDRPL